MKHYPSLTKIVFALALTAVIIGFSAFRQKHQGAAYSFRKGQYSKDEDTTSQRKRNRNGANRDFYKIDEQMKLLELQMEKLDEQMKKLDMSKYEKEIDEAMKNIDMEKITKQIDSSVKNIDWEQINNQIAEQASVNLLRAEEMKRQMQRAKENFEKQKFNLRFNGQKIKENTERALKNARQYFENAKERIKNVKEFTGALEKDGLIDESKAYKIEVKSKLKK